ncbi:autotransporter domain-containing protein [Providencia rustigianii]|uniref:Outer membrane autotransporter barrel domain protein n=2 Tax=Providencia rustigianii TaxID=158850 RepID=D1P7D3_9GAMM|nr:autotransporter domain-containing protein [Providencia rustigianii]EFB70673.1 outer membrane autotransporter barrel domain protein [Providencia rustigianii DSM 4541]SUC25034.1 Extracellular serine protease precursor [Providencia rustigianii]
MNRITPAVSLSLFALFNAQITLANSDYIDASKSIIDQRNQRFDELRNQVIPPYPTPQSQAAQWDKDVSQQVMQLTGKRKKSAEKDKKSTPEYIFNIYREYVFNQKGFNYNDFKEIKAYNRLEHLFHLATFANDPIQNRIRSIDFILKDYYLRGRPNQVLDHKGEYLPNYIGITGSSYPSGHTWNGFKQAAIFATIYPEKGTQFFDRAIGYGESRVIVGAHFPTDTITSRAANYYLLAHLLKEDKTANAMINLAKEVRQDLQNQCTISNKKCKPPVGSLPSFNENLGYYAKQSEQPSPALQVDQVPADAAYLLRSRFAYLNKSQWQQIIAGTAYPTNSLAGWGVKQNQPESHWGLINLPKAYKGPTHLAEDWVVNQRVTQDDVANIGIADTWSNNIEGKGRLIKQGEGTLTLTGTNRFAGLDIQQGRVILTQENHLTGPININGGELNVKHILHVPVDVTNGTLQLSHSIRNTVTLNQGARFIASGSVDDLVVNSGAILTPGDNTKDPTRRITVNNTATFQPGSEFHVDLQTTDTQEFDALQSSDTVVINGGKVKVFFAEKSPPFNERIPNEDEIQNRFRTEYTIISAKKIQGKFDGVEPNYLFIGTTLDYGEDPRSPTTKLVTLNVGRSDLAFDTFAKTPNQTAVAHALENLSLSNTLYERLVLSKTTVGVNDLLRTLSPQIHIDTLASQLNNHRQYHGALLQQTRISENIVKERGDNRSNMWVNIPYHWDRTQSDGNASGFTNSNYGVFLGADKHFFNDDFIFGISSGFTKNSVSGGVGHSHSNNYYLAAYGSLRLAPITLRAGLGHTWHTIKTERTVTSSIYSDHNTADYKGKTNHLFMEAAYPWKSSIINAEPFVNFAFTNAESHGFRENGEKASLVTGRQSLDATTTTLGLRLDNQWEVGNTSSIDVHGELGWQHQYDKREREMAFRFTHRNLLAPPLNYYGVNAPRDGMAIKLGSSLQLTDNTKLSMDYSQFTAKGYLENNLDAKLLVSF